MLFPAELVDSGSFEFGFRGEWSFKGRFTGAIFPAINDNISVFIQFAEVSQFKSTAIPPFAGFYFKQSGTFWGQWVTVIQEGGGAVNKVLLHR